MKKSYSMTLIAALSAGALMTALPSGARAQTVGTTTGQNPTGFSMTGGVTQINGTPVSPTGSPFDKPAVPLGPGGLPISSAGGTVPEPGNFHGLASAAASAYGQAGSGAQLHVSHIPNEGEKDANGQTVHYKMADHEPGTGTGLLTGIKLPSRAFNNVESYDDR